MGKRRGFLTFLRLLLILTLKPFENQFNQRLPKSYRYDINGLRTSKNVSGTSSSYYYTGGRLTYEKRGEHELFFAYDSFGSLNMIRHKHGENTTSYLAVCNSRGDVEALYSTSGSLLATYTYDSWGNILSIKDANGNSITDQNHIANLNPIRYRGYYYDAEIGVYYLKFRYYDPITSRFINADAYMGELGDATSHNLFAYCRNNPVNRFDPNGMDDLHTEFMNFLNIFLKGMAALSLIEQKYPGIVTNSKNMSASLVGVKDGILSINFLFQHDDSWLGVNDYYITFYMGSANAWTTQLKSLVSHSNFGDTINLIIAENIFGFFISKAMANNPYGILAGLFLSATTAALEHARQAISNFAVHSLLVIEETLQYDRNATFGFITGFHEFGSVFSKTRTWFYDNRIWAIR